MECQHCKKIFNNKYTLGQHQKTAKYCLDLQGSTNINFICTYCNKNLCTNDRLNTHYHACKEKQKQDTAKDIKVENEYLKKVAQGHEVVLKEKNEYIAKLEAKLEKFENAVTNMAAATTLAMDAKASKENKENKEDMPVTLKEQMSSIVIEEAKEDIEYSNINNVIITSRPLDHS